MNYAAGSGSAYAITAGDFNGDGKLDLALADQGWSGIDLLTGKGDGTFQVGGSYYTGNGPQFAASAELNGDGRTDVIVANLMGSNITVLLGTSVYATTTSLVSSLNPSTVGQNITLTATVTPVAATGTVTFLDGAVAISTIAVTNGSATLTDSKLTAGSHLLTASYSGDVTNSQSVSRLLTQTVNRIVPTVTLTSSANPSIFGQSVTLTANVSPSSATGKVTFKNGSATLGIVTLSGGTASLTLSSLATGSHSLVANYGGDAKNAPGVSTALTQKVSKIVTSTTLTSSANPSAYGKAVIFGATVSPTTTTGMITFKSGSQTLGTASLAMGTATLTSSSLNVGAHSITAVYSGDANDGSSTSAPLTQTVTKNVTSTTIGSSLNPSTVGQSIVFTAAVLPSSATGMVTFQDGSKTLGSATLTGGTATFSSTSLTAGSHSVSAAYGGDANDGTSASAPISQTVQP